MRRTILTMATTMALTVLVVSGVALAANIACVVGATQCVGTSQKTTISLAASKTTPSSLGMETTL